MVRLKRILVPTDFSESAGNALRYGVSFAKEYSAELILLHVVETISLGYPSDPFPVSMNEVFQEILAHARGQLETLAQEVRGRGVVVREILAQGQPPSEIVHVARTETVDLIVLGTHGKGVLNQALFGSTTERVARKAPCPVLTCRLSEHEFVD